MSRDQDNLRKGALGLDQSKNVHTQSKMQYPSLDGVINTDRAIALYGYCPVGPAWQ